MGSWNKTKLKPIIWYTSWITPFIHGHVQETGLIYFVIGIQGGFRYIYIFGFKEI